MFVSNFVGGVVPGPVTEALEAARVRTGNRTGKMIGYFGHDRFERELLELEAEEVEDIVGPIVIDQDFIHLQPEAVRNVIGALSAAFRAP